jgi:hypothetical protein
MNDYKKKYLKYKQKYINLKSSLKGGACNRCPILGFSQHYEECWHDTLSTIMLFSDGICEIIQPIFENNIETIIIQINKNIDENKIPEYYLPFNIESSDKEFFKNEVNQYIRQLYFRYHNEYKDIALLETLQDDIKEYPFFRQPSLECSLESVKNIFNKIIDGIKAKNTPISLLNKFSTLIQFSFTYRLLNLVTAPFFLHLGTLIILIMALIGIATIWLNHWHLTELKARNV